MAVTVVNSRLGGMGGVITGKDVYEAANTFSVDGLGHLLVTQEERSGHISQMAAYKPNAWLSAYVDESITAH